jgi:hypothetical protein
MPRPANAFLTDPIRDVQNNAHGNSAMATYSNPIGGYRNWPGGRRALFEEGIGYPPPVTDLNAKRLLSVLAYKNFGDIGRLNIALGNTTVGDFRNMNQAQQLSFIDGLWNALTSVHPFMTPAENMFDPVGNAPVNERAPLPTSWKPDNTKRLQGRPWQTYRVGFRVDGSDPASIARVLQHGMTQQRLNLAFMRNVRGLEISSTAAAISSTARCWTSNNDIFNETAVCVSRNFFGATAFPERATIHAPGQVAYLWAIDCSGLMGFDTEDYQRNLPGNRNWRPGEKAFRVITPDRIIGYIPVRRHGCPERGGWSFSIDNTTTWSLVNHVIDFRKRDYINGELDAWKGRRHDIPGSHDFAT